MQTARVRSARRTAAPRLSRADDAARRGPPPRTWCRRLAPDAAHVATPAARARTAGLPAEGAPVAAAARRGPAWAPALRVMTGGTGVLGRRRGRRAAGGRRARRVVRRGRAVGVRTGAPAARSAVGDGDLSSASGRGLDDPRLGRTPSGAATRSGRRSRRERPRPAADRRTAGQGRDGHGQQERCGGPSFDAPAPLCCFRHRNRSADRRRVPRTGDLRPRSAASSRRCSPSSTPSARASAQRPGRAGD
ncbi:hypothetical protein SALBM311S_02958 [Streptomyces alboniger]